MLGVSFVLIGFSILAFTNVVTPLVVISGSMEPEITTGSLIVSKKADTSSFKVGDVASLPREDGVIVTHRVISNEPSPDNTDLRIIKMKGDANDDADQVPYVASKALAPVVVIPEVGKAVAVLANNKIQLFAFMCFVAATYLVVNMFSAFRKTRKTDTNTSEDIKDEKI